MVHTFAMTWGMPRAPRWCLMMILIEQKRWRVRGVSTPWDVIFLPQLV